MDKDLALLPKQTIGVLVMISMVSIFIVHFVFLLPPLTTCGAITIALIIALFFHRPLYGFLAIIVLRTSVDFFASHFSIMVSENIHLNIASIFALLLIAMSTLLIAKQPRIFFTHPLLIPFGLFIIFCATTYTYSIDKTATFAETLRVMSIFMSCATSYLLCTALLQARKTIITTLLLSAILPLSFAFFQLFTGTGFTDNLGTDGRLFGTFTQPNAFASFLLLIIALTTYRIFDKHHTSLPKTSSITLLSIAVMLLILTFSRGGWLGCIVFFTLLGILRAPKMILVVITVSTIAFFTSQTVHDRIEDIYNPPADSSIRWRVQQWKDALAAWQLSPVFGHGAGTEIAIHEQEKGFYAGNPYTHNDFIKTLQETGIIGFTLFTLLMCTTLLLLIRTYRTLSADEEKNFTLIVTLLFFAEMCFGMSSNIWRGTAVEWLLWTLVACALSLNTRKKTPLITTQRSQR